MRALDLGGAGDPFQRQQAQLVRHLVVVAVMDGAGQHDDRLGVVEVARGVGHLRFEILQEPARNIGRGETVKADQAQKRDAQPQLLARSQRDQYPGERGDDEHRRLQHEGIGEEGKDRLGSL